MSLFKKKEKAELNDLDVLDEIKEPFTWSNFWDEKIVGSWKKTKKFLDEKGILFFLMSPFQYRNRLIGKLVLITVGLLLGVVPRASNMIQEAKKRNAASELSQIAGKTFTNDIIAVTPLASGRQDRTHVIVFQIEGDTDDGVPSVTDGFDVKLTTNRGVTDEGNIKYSYMIKPIDVDTRLLVMYVDNSKQNDKTGIFNVSVAVAGGKQMSTPMTVVLSDNQDETDVYTEDGIELSAVASSLVSGETTAIKDAEKALEDKLIIYQHHYNRLNQADLRVDLTPESLRKYIKERLVMTSVNDKSNTKDIEGLTIEEPEFEPLEISMTPLVNGKPDGDVKYIHGKVVASDLMSGNAQAPLPEGYEAMVSVDQRIVTDLDQLKLSVDTIIDSARSLNAVRTTKFMNLTQLQNALNSPVNLDEMKDGGKVTIGKSGE